MTGQTPGPGKSVASKITAILLTLAGGSSHSMSDVARQTGLPPSTAHRLLAELEAERVLERQDDGRYRIALPLRSLAASRHGHTTVLIGRGLRTLEDLSAVIGGRARLGALHNGQVAFLEDRSPHRTASFTRAPLQPAHATAMGRAILAFLPASDITSVITRGARASTPHRITSTSRFQRALAGVLRSRVAISCSEFEPDICAVAAPVFGPGGHVAAALEIAVPADRDSHGHDTLTSVVQIASRSLSRDLAAAAEQHPNGDPAGPTP